MEFNGRIMKLLPIQSGTGKNGNWQKLEFIFEYFESETDRYSDKVCLSIMNDKIAEYDLHENDEVLIGFGHSIREYQGRYYNEVRLYKLQKKGQGAPKPAQQPNTADPNSAQANAAQANAAQQNAPQQKMDDMPF